MDRFLDNLKKEAEENPIVALGVAAALITALSKLIDSGATSRNSRAWIKEVDRRVKKS